MESSNASQCILAPAKRNGCPLSINCEPERVTKAPLTVCAGSFPPQTEQLLNMVRMRSMVEPGVSNQDRGSTNNEMHVGHQAHVPAGSRQPVAGCSTAASAARGAAVQSGASLPEPHGSCCQSHSGRE